MALVVSPVLQAKVSPRLTLMLTAVPGQMIPVALLSITGLNGTRMTTSSKPKQPASLIPVTRYAAPSTGATEMEGPVPISSKVSRLYQLKVSALPLAVRVTVSPGQALMVSCAIPATTLFSSGGTSSKKGSEAQPLRVATRVYCPGCRAMGFWLAELKPLGPVHWYCTPLEGDAWPYNSMASPAMQGSL